jgi:hypothetical protein
MATAFKVSSKVEFLSICFSFLFMSCACPVLGSDKPREFDFGFIASRLEDPDGNMRLKLLGPIYERAVSTHGAQLRAVRPFYSSYTDPATERHEKDMVWPIAAAKRFRHEFSWRVLLTWYLDYDRTDSKSRYRFWSLPIYFQGRDRNQGFYMAIFPLGGRVCDILGRDEIRFVLFPLYAKSRINDVQTKDILWPIYSRTEGEGIHRFRVFPFYGRNQHRENFEKRFIMWPFWTWAHYKYPRASGTAYVLWPLWGHFDLEDQKAWLFVPPLVRFSCGQRMNYNYCPWPLIQWSSGEIEKFYLWPLWGKKNMQGVRSAFFLWPIFRTEQRDRGETYSQRFLAMPFIYSEIRKQRSHDPTVRPTVVARYHKIWPLLSYIQEDDHTRFRLLELWPLKNTGPVEREYAPIWTLFSHTVSGDSCDDELLWGLYRNRKRGSEYRSVSLFPVVSWTRDDRERESREWLILKGLLGYKREGTRKSLRVLYLFHVGGKEKNP